MRREGHPIRRWLDHGRALPALVMVFSASAFGLLFLRDFRWQALALGVAVPLMIWLTTRVMPRHLPADSLMLSLMSFLCALGVLVLYDTNPHYAYHQAMYYGVGLVAMEICIALVRAIRSWRGLTVLLMAGSLGALALPLVIGREINGASNWIELGRFSLQPSELVKLSLLIVLAWCMSRKRFLPWVLFAAACLALLMLQKDLGTALLYYATALLMYWASTGSWGVSALGLAGGAGAAVLGYRMFAHVKKRVAIWRNPWADYDSAGYQIVQGLMAIASGGLFGVGLGLGSPKAIPVYHTDFIFAVICEQFGVLFGLMVLAMYVALIWRGATTAMAARTSFHGLLAMGATIMLALQTFVIIGGVIKLIPLTGVTMPFVSYGGSSLLSSMCLIGLIQGVESVNERDIAGDAYLAELGEREGGSGR